MLNSSMVNAQSSGKKKRSHVVYDTASTRNSQSPCQEKNSFIYKVYDCLKRGTDMVDQRTKFYTSKAKSRHDRFWLYTRSSGIQYIFKATQPKLF